MKSAKIQFIFVIFDYNFITRFIIFWKKYIMLETISCKSKLHMQNDKLYTFEWIMIKIIIIRKWFKKK